MAMPSEDAVFRALYDAHYAHILAYCRRRIGAADAQDAAADVFLTAWRRRDAVPDHEEALPWLYGVARKVLANRRRGSRRASRLVEKVGASAPIPQAGPETVVVRNAADQEVVEALARLKEDDCEVIRLSVWEELSHAEIGAALGLSDRAVSMRLHRALKRLGRQLGRAGAQATPRVATEGGES